MTPGGSELRGTFVVRPAMGSVEETIRRIEAKEDYFQVLGLKRDASSDEIKKAYRKLALRLHPDKCSCDGADGAFKKVSTAYACLSDEKKRESYLRFGRDLSELSLIHI